MFNQNEEVTQRRERIYAYAPLILWAGVILILGGGTGSAAQTSRFIKPLIEFFFPSASPDTFLLVHALIRKAAHFIEYGVLALLAVRAFRRSVVPIVWRHWAAFAFMAAMFVSIIDEVNQSFNAERTGSASDLVLDMAGAAAAIVICVLVNVRRGTMLRQNHRAAQ